jgi:hypothetical protein
LNYCPLGCGRLTSWLSNKVRAASKNSLDSSISALFLRRKFGLNFFGSFFSAFFFLSVLVLILPALLYFVCTTPLVE